MLYFGQYNSAALIRQWEFWHDAKFLFALFDCFFDSLEFPMMIVMNHHISSFAESRVKKQMPFKIGWYKSMSSDTKAKCLSFSSVAVSGKYPFLKNAFCGCFRRCRTKSICSSGVLKLQRLKKLALSKNFHLCGWNHDYAPNLADFIILVNSKNCFIQNLIDTMNNYECLR